MKLLPTVLLNVAVVLVTLVVYDQTRGDNAAPPPPSPPARDPALSAIEARLAALEAAWRLGPEANAPDPGILARLDALERRRAAPPEEDPSAATIEPGVVAPPAGEEPSPEAVAEFKRLQAAARQEERRRRMADQVGRALKKLGISLTGEQRGKLVTTWDEFEGRRNEIWSEVKKRVGEGGSVVDWRQTIEDTNRLIVRELTERIAVFIPGEDAERLATGLNGWGK